MNHLPRRPVSSIAIAGLVSLAALAALWLWVQWCRFPWSAWNDIRLAPSFMLAAGEPVYSAPGPGVVSTWMYGPVPVWLLLPAAWMPDIVSASLTAGGLNIGIQLLAILFACARWPAGGLSASSRATAVCLVVAAWPEAAWRFIQADNFAVALGLLSSTLLLRKGCSPAMAWLAAAAAAAAVGCKQTSLGIPLAQVVWLASTRGRIDALEHAMRLAGCGALLGLATLTFFDPAGLWDTLVRLPGQIPFTDEIGRRLADLAPLLLIHLALPPAVFLMLRRQPDPGGARRLGLLLWLFGAPLGLLSLIKAGGTLNSLQGFQLALPVLALGLCSALSSLPRAITLAPLVIGALFLVRLQATGVPMKPRSGHLTEGVALVRANPGQLWLPWNPLVSYYGEGRFYHAEDGFYARLLAGRALSRDQIKVHLPPSFTAIAEPVGLNGWGISENLLERPFVEHVSGAWRLRVAVPEAPPPPSS